MEATALKCNNNCVYLYTDTTGIPLLTLDMFVMLKMKKQYNGAYPNELCVEVKGIDNGLEY